MTFTNPVTSAIEAVASGVAVQLNWGLPVWLVFEPGNATRYEIVITPRFSAKHVDAQARMTGQPGPRQRNDDERNDFLVSLPEWRSSYVSTPGFTHPTYLCEKLRVSGGDAVVLADLLNAIWRALSSYTGDES